MDDDLDARGKTAHRIEITAIRLHELDVVGNVSMLTRNEIVAAKHGVTAIAKHTGDMAANETAYAGDKNPPGH
jgi:putative heme degradation protein